MTIGEVKKGGCLTDTRGLATVEYILIACLVALISFGAFKALGGTVGAKVDEATATIAQLPSESEDGGAASASSMATGTMALGAGSSARGGDGCAAHVAAGGGAGAPCDPASFGSCVGGGDTTVVITCDPGTGLTVAR